ncbi:DUF6412 domain-containing protein [Streptomyces sp. ME02-6991-2B]|nr:DUF6412 domain-containing protein [Streptomyces sp. ME02-6991-2B]
MIRSTAATARLHGAALLLLLTALLLTHTGITATVAAAATTAAVALLLGSALRLAATAPPVPRGHVRTALRDRERRTAFLPQRDPDASGRPRPRAPGHPLPTAA